MIKVIVEGHSETFGETRIVVEADCRIDAPVSDVYLATRKILDQAVNSFGQAIKKKFPGQQP